MPVLNGPSTHSPNLTHKKIRLEGCSTCRREYQLDASWGIPSGGTPMFRDPDTGLVRPSTSIPDLTIFCANFVGFTDEFVEVGDCKRIWINKCAVVEMELATPAVVMTGDRFQFTLETDATNTWVSPRIIEPAPDPTAACAVFEAVRGCFCNCFPGGPCPPKAPAPAVASPIDTDQIQRATQKTVDVAFGCCIG